MRPKKNLFFLIKSLSPAEKKYFRKQAAQNPNRGANNYLRLFDAIEKEETYQEKALKAKFAGDGLAKHFANVKAYLYKMILQSMRTYHQDNEPRNAIEDLIAHASFLWKKSLYDESAKTYRKAVAEARKIEAFDLELQALQALCIDCFTRTTRGALEALKTLEDQIEIAMRREEQLNRLQLKNHRLFLLSRQYYDSRSPEVLQSVEELMDDELLKGETELDFFKGNSVILQCQAHYHQMKGNWSSNLTYRRKVMELWESQPEMISHYTHFYRNILANFLAACGIMGEYGEFPQTLKKLHNYPVSSPDQEAEVFQNAAFFELLYYMNTLNFEAAKQAIHEIEDGLVRYAAKINHARLLSFRYNMMIYFFLVEDFSGALRYVNLMLNDKASEHRQDIQQASRIFSLIFHYELGHIDLLDGLFRSVYRYLYGRERLFPFEKTLLRFMKKISNLPIGESPRDHYSNLLTDLQQINEAPDGHKPPGIQEIIYWLQSRIEGRSIVEVFKQDNRDS